MTATGRWLNPILIEPYPRKRYRAKRPGEPLFVLIRIETRAGHGAGRPISKVIEESADKLAFADYFMDNAGGP